MHRSTLVLASSPACSRARRRSSAHDFWIEPTGFMADLGRVVGVKLRVGDDFHGDPVPRNDDAHRATSSSWTPPAAGRWWAATARIRRACCASPRRD